MSVTPHTAMWIALVVAVLAVAVCVWMGRRSWRAYTRLERTRDAATALLDVHTDRLLELTDTTREHAGTLGAGGEQVAASVAVLRADVSHLRWLLDRIPEERARLRRTILDILLPTSRRSDDEERERDDVRA